jgi:uncharacterized protein (DUF697 family)
VSKLWSWHDTLGVVVGAGSGSVVGVTLMTTGVGFIPSNVIGGVVTALATITWFVVTGD